MGDLSTAHFHFRGFGLSRAIDRDSFGRFVLCTRGRYVTHEKRAPAEARETLPRLSWRASFLTIGIGGSVDGEKRRDGTFAGDKNARPGVSKGRFWRIALKSLRLIDVKEGP